MNVNELLFSRNSFDKKKDIIKNLNYQELASISQTLLIRIIKESGKKIGKGRTKELIISKDHRIGNNWNSEFEGMGYSDQLYIILYVQYSNTDLSYYESFEKFFIKCDYRGSLHYQDAYGNPHTVYFTYTEKDKMECIRSVLLEYLERKIQKQINFNSNSPL